jgi:DNA-binding MarR family transcriptional regulator
MMLAIKPSVSNDEKVTLRGALAALEPFKQLNATMPLQYVTAFLLVALHEGESVAWYAKQAGVSPSVMTRHLLDIGEYNRYHEEGYGLVEQTIDPMDRRSHKARLTVKGRGLVSTMIRALTAHRGK